MGPNRSRAILICLTLVLTLGGFSTQAEEVAQERSAQDLAFDATVLRHFESAFSIDEFGLLTRSHVNSLKKYLRMTRSPYLVHLPLIHSRLITDDYRLAQLYHKHKGAKVLRKVAAEVGGFGPIDKLCNLPGGTLTVRQAVRSGDPQRLIAKIQEKQAQQEQDSAEMKPKTTKKPRIYTVRELIEAILETANS